MCKIYFVLSHVVHLSMSEETIFRSDLAPHPLRGQGPALVQLWEATCE